MYKLDKKSRRWHTKFIKLYLLYYYLLYLYYSIAVKRRAIEIKYNYFQKLFKQIISFREIRSLSDFKFLNYLFLLRLYEI